ncbi:MAG: tandem-95 repeat protein, partial [bacterium]
YGDFIIAWQSDGQDGDGWGIYDKVWRESGALLHDEILRNTSTVGDQQSVTVGMEGDGDYTLAWVSDGQDGDAGGIYADNVAWGGSGTNTAGEFRISSTTAGDQDDPEIANDPTGNFIVTWTSTGQDGDAATETNVYGQIYNMQNSGPVIVGSEFLVNNSYTTGIQGHPAVAAAANGNVISAWSGETAASTYGVSHKILTNALQNEVPVIKLANAAISYTEGDAPLAIDTALTITDADSTHLAGATVSFRDGFAAGEDQLNFSDQLGITGSYVTATGILTLSGSATITDYQTALRTVTYSNSSYTPSTTQRIVEVKVDDGTASSSDTRKLNVSATNTAPIIDNLAPSIAENTTSLTITATDPEGDAITGYSISGGADAALFNLDGATGVLTFNTAPDYESPADANGDNVYEVEITTTDGLGATLAQLVSISVTNVNEAPTANNSTVTTDEDSEYTFTTADFNFSDIDGDALSSIKITTLENAGSLELNGSAVTLNQVVTAADITAGNLKFMPTANANGNGYDSFDFSVNDGALDSTGSYTMTLNVTPINDTPVIATNSGVTIAEGSTGTVITTAMLNEGDVDDTGTGLTYTVTSPVSNGTLKLNGIALAMNDSFSQADIDGGRVSYDHDGSQTASDSFSFTLADGGEDGAVAVTVTFNISVTNVNDAPVNTVPGTQSVNEDTALAIGGISIADDDNNLSTVQLTVSSGTLNVALAGSASISAGANGSADLTLSGSLVDINTTLGTLTYQGNAHFNGSDTLTVLSTDASGATDSDTVAITVNPVNDSPVNTVPASVAVTEDAATALKGISIADVDSGNSTILLTLSVPSGTLTASSGGGVTVGGTTTDLMLYGTVVEINNFIAASNVAYTSATNANGSVALTVLTSDQGNTGSGGALTDSDSVSLVISAVNDAPTATNLSAAETYVEDTSLNLTDIVSTDVDSNVTVTLVLSDTAAGSLNSGTAGAVTSTYNAGTGIWVASGAVADVNALLAALTFTPALNYDSNFAMATSVSDGVNPAVTGTKSFTGTPVDDLPLLTSPANFTVSENSQTVTTLTATDIDSPANMRGFSITGGADAALFTLDADTGVMSFINAPDHETPADANGDNVYEIQVTVDDGQGGQSTGSLRVTISNVDEPPHLVNANSPGSYTEDTPLSLGDIQIQDVDGGTATLTITLSDPAAGFLTDDPGSLGSLGISDANGQWTALGSIEQINAALANLVFIPGADQNADVTLSIRLDDGITTVDLGEKLIVGIPVADTPQVSGTSTGRDTLTAPISITPNPNDGDEVTYFQISQIKQGSLFLADGTTPLKEGDFISRQQAEQGVRFLPAPDATGNGSFTVQASLDGVGVSPGSTPASASIVVSTPVPISPELPPEPVQAHPSPEPISGSTPPTQLPVSEDNSPAESSVFVEPPREQNMADGQAAESDKTVAVPIQKNLSSAEAKESGERTRLELSGIQTRTSSAATAQLLNLMLDEVNLSQHQITVSSYQNLYDSLETIRREQSLDKLAESRIIGTAATVSSGLTMGYVVWMIRGGMLASSVMVSLPAWQIADPLPILGGGKTADEDDESLESIIENSKSKTSPPLQHSDQEQEPVA